MSVPIGIECKRKGIDACRKVTRVRSLLLDIDRSLVKPVVIESPEVHKEKIEQARSLALREYKEWRRQHDYLRNSNRLANRIQTGAKGDRKEQLLAESSRVDDKIKEREARGWAPREWRTGNAGRVSSAVREPKELHEMYFETIRNKIAVLQEERD
jgi:hypothetical protein